MTENVYDPARFKPCPQDDCGRPKVSRNPDGSLVAACKHLVLVAESLPRLRERWNGGQ